MNDFLFASLVRLRARTKTGCAVIEGKSSVGAYAARGSTGVKGIRHIIGVRQGG